MSTRNPISRATRTAKRKLGVSDAVRHGGLHIPPPELRQGGRHFQDDAAFVASGVADAHKLCQAFELRTDTRLLDVGSGVGRLAIGLLSRVGEMTAYVGVDVAERSVRWCTRNITSRHPGMRFVHVDVANERYHPGGQPIGNAFRFPFAARSFDVIQLYSVFSHMEAADVRAYLREFQRLLADGGGVMLTAFVEDDVEDVAVNPPGYGPMSWDGALHCVRFSRSFFESLVTEAGLRVERTDHGAETDGQSAIYLRAAQLPH